MKVRKMKKLLLFIFCFTSFASYSQERNNPHIYLNNKEINLDNVFLNPKSIDSMYIEKKTSVGEIYIVAKEQTEFIDLDSVLLIYTKLNKEQNNILYIINDKIVKNESDILIDKSYFLKVITQGLSEVEYLNESYKDLVIVDISLHTEKVKPNIRIRGIDNSIYPINKR
jgi:hypothetical protein